MKDESKLFFDFFSGKPEKGLCFWAKADVLKIVRWAENVWVFDRSNSHHHNLGSVFFSWSFDETRVKFVEQLEDVQLEGFPHIVDERQVVLVHQNQRFCFFSPIFTPMVLQKFWKKNYASFELAISEECTRNRFVLMNSFEFG